MTWQIPDVALAIARAVADDKGRALIVGGWVRDQLLGLESKDLVIGPAVDGGYYLIGCRPPAPPIFDGIDWGSISVLAKTIERLHDTGRSLAVLPPWYDVDTPDSLAVRAARMASKASANSPVGSSRVTSPIGPRCVSRVPSMPMRSTWPRALREGSAVS